jgi:cyclin-dependent kinase 7
MENYTKKGELGAGTFGVVYDGERKEDGLRVAMKKIRMGERRSGVSFTAIREIKILQELKHEHIVGLLDVFIHHQSIFLIFEFMQTDLEAVVLDKSIPLSAADIKSYMRMLLLSVEVCHKQYILHRDIKPGNLLIGADGTLKLADFGLAKQYGSPNARMTKTVVTRWYRAPELLYGAERYGFGVDVWACGMIFAELMLRGPLAPGDSDIDQLAKIFAVLGTPTEELWPGMESLPDYVAFTKTPAIPLKQMFSAASDDAIDLLSKMLKYDPNQRITATEALQHPYFSSAPPPTAPNRLQLPRPKHVLYKQENPHTRNLRKEMEASGDVSVKKRLEMTED